MYTHSVLALALLLIICCREKAPPPLGRGFISWIWSVLTVKEETIIECSGLDAAINLRFLLFGVKLFAFACLYGFIVLVPVNAVWEFEL